jgi:hypothetical protein
MQVTVRSDLVSRLQDFLDQSRISLGNPTQCEKGATNATRVEQIEEVPGRGDHPAGQLVPTLDSRPAFDAADVEPLLDVNGERVQHGLNQLRCSGGRSSTLR